MNISSRQLKAFILVAEHQSFSRAAEAFFITQSGLSILVRELELQLGFRLFNRTTRRVTLTEYGTKLLPVAQRHVTEFENVMLSIGRSVSTRSHLLSIGTTPLMAAHLLPSVISSFESKNRNLMIRLVDDDRPALLNLVESGKLDIGLLVFLNPTTRVRRAPVFRFQLMAVRASNGSHWQSTIRWSDLKDEIIIGLGPTNEVQQLIDRNLLRAGRHSPPDLYVNNIGTQIGLAEAGTGIAITPSITYAACHNRNLVAQRLIDPVVEVELFEIRNCGIKLPPVADKFTKFLRDYIAAWAVREKIP